MTISKFRLIAVAVLCCVISSSYSQAGTIYSEDFEGTGGTVPTNWAPQTGSTGTATLTIVDESAGIGTGDALNIDATTRGGTIGMFPATEINDIGDVIELSFDIRLTSFPNNSGGLRFGLHGTNAPFASGYRISVGTGANVPSTDITVENGTSDVLFGGNGTRVTLSTANANGINDNDTHSMLLRVERTALDEVEIEVFQDGVSSTGAPVAFQSTDILTGSNAGSYPIKTAFDMITFSTNGGVTGNVDNFLVTVNGVPEPSTIALWAGGLACMVVCHRRRKITS